MTSVVRDLISAYAIIIAARLITIYSHHGMDYRIRLHILHPHILL